VASPVVQDVAETAVSTAGTSHAITLPAGIAASDLVLIIMDIGSTAATLNALTDWTEDLDENLANGLKILRYTGTGVPSNPTFTSSAATRSASLAYRISGADKSVAPQIATTATGTSATPDPPSITPTGGVSDDYLSIAFYGAAGEEADDDTWSDTPPTNWTPSPPRQKACGVAGTNLGGMIAAAERQITTGSAIDPGTFAKDVSAAWRAQHILIHPSDVVAAEVDLSPITVTASLGEVVPTPTVSLGGGGGELAITAGPSTSDGVGATSINVTLPGSMADGDWTLVFPCLNSSAGLIATPSGWTALLAESASDAASGSTSHHMAIFARKWVSGDPSTLTVSASATGRWGVATAKVSGADASSVIEGTVGLTKQTSATTAIDAPSRVSTDSKLLVTAHSGRSATSGTIITWTPPSGMTEVSEAGPASSSTTVATIEVASLVITAGATTGVKTATASSTATGSQGASLLLEPAAGGGGDLAVTVTLGELSPSEGGGAASVNLDPITVTASLGTVVPTPTIALSPVTVTASLGTVSPEAPPAGAVNLSPITVTVSLGTVSARPTVGLSPVTVLAQLGTVSARPTVGLSPVTALAQLGTVSARPTVGLSPVTATVSLGTVFPEAPPAGGVNLSPITVTVQLGTVSARPTVGLSPVTVLAQLGTVSARPTVGLSPVTALVQLGTVSARPTVGLSPVMVTISLGTVSPQAVPTIGLVPISVLVGLGTLSAEAGQVVIGIFAGSLGQLRLAGSLGQPRFAGNFGQSRLSGRLSDG
jgi:hypothetical protein